MCAKVIVSQLVIALFYGISSESLSPLEPHTISAQGVINKVDLDPSLASTSCIQITVEYLVISADIDYLCSLSVIKTCFYL